MGTVANGLNVAANALYHIRTLSTCATLWVMRLWVSPVPKPVWRYGTLGLRQLQNRVPKQVWLSLRRHGSWHWGSSSVTKCLVTDKDPRGRKSHCNLPPLLRDCSTTSLGGRGGLVAKSNDCKAKAMRDGQGSPPRQWKKSDTPLPTTLLSWLTDFLIVYVYVRVYLSLGAWKSSLQAKGCSS